MQISSQTGTSPLEVTEHGNMNDLEHFYFSVEEELDIFMEEGYPPPFFVESSEKHKFF